MKFLSSTGLIILASFIIGLYMPWWSIAIVSMGISIIIPQKPFIAFLSGFLGTLTLWMGISFWIDMGNHHLLSSKVAQILPLGGSWILLLLITGLIAGIVGGLAALCGSFARSIPVNSQD